MFVNEHIIVSIILLCSIPFLSIQFIVFRCELSKISSKKHLRYACVMRTADRFNEMHLLFTETNTNIGQAINDLSENWILKKEMYFFCFFCYFQRLVSALLQRRIYTGFFLIKRIRVWVGNRLNVFSPLSFYRN